MMVERLACLYILFVALAEHGGMVFSYDQLLDKIWGHDYYGETRVVDVHLGHIRQKIGEESIATVRGVGYQFDGERDEI